ncbi:MAG: hypothetical protein K2Q09_04105 [Phycisphaerales bacterium]|nr:hypothetical protein [Phycisphaerales bacterium]
MSPFRRAAPALAIAATVITVVLPLGGVVLRMVWPGPAVHTSGAAAPGGTPAPPLTVLLVTLGVPVVIALGSVLLAWPTVWLLRPRCAPGAGRAAFALLLVPMLMPSYLAYAGFGLARAPGTVVGEVVNRWPATLNVLFGQSLAVAGLMLWCWPLGTIALLGPVRRIGQEQLDQLALSGAGRWARTLERARMLRGSLLAALGLITLLMLGSAVPLHLAVIPTLAIDLWARLALAPASTDPWLSAWPVLVAAAVGAAALVRWFSADEPHDQRADPAPPPRRGAWAVPVAAWCLAVVLPLVLFATSLKHARLLGDFWRGHAQSVIDSLTVASGVGGVLVGLALTAWYAAETPGGRRITAAVLSVQLLGFLIPGVLMGSAVVGLVNHPVLGEFGRTVADSTAIVVLGHVARFGSLGTAAGLWLSRLEAPNLRDARLLAAGDGVGAWLSLAVRPQAPTLIGVGIAGACLSLHEIEATVQLQPPGYRSLAQVMLDNLHMNSIHELSAAGLNVLGVGVLLAAAGAVLLARAARSTGSRIG